MNWNIYFLLFPPFSLSTEATIADSLNSAEIVPSWSFPCDASGPWPLPTPAIVVSEPFHWKRIDSSGQLWQWHIKWKSPKTKKAKCNKLSQINSSVKYPEMLSYPMSIALFLFTVKPNLIAFVRIFFKLWNAAFRLAALSWTSRPVFFFSMEMARRRLVAVHCVSFGPSGSFSPQKLVGK